MLAGASEVSIVLESGEGNTARLAIQVDSLAGERAPDPSVSDRFDRIITGLARQLRSPLDQDAPTGRYSVTIAIVGRGA
jgi:hypothetical protein